jgi:hypothetical protein
MKKKCIKCKKLKDLNDYYVHRTSTDGRAYSCKECEIVYNRKLREQKKKDLEFVIY